MSDIKISPFKISIPDSELSDLKRRLAATRWPEKETVHDKSQGVPLTVVQELYHYWLDTYDWRRCETWINEAGSFKAEIDGCYGIHFLHIRSRHENALPLLLLHGWPGSILEFRKAADALTDPTEHGGSADDAFHLVIPAMPGYGFSDKPVETGTGLYRMSQLYIRLMEALGYTSWAAQGGDWGADICAALAARDNNPPQALLSVHLNCLYFDGDKEVSSEGARDDAEKLSRAKAKAFSEDEHGYYKQQATRPQTIGYGLADSPVGQLAWIYEKIQSWTQNDGDVQKVLTQDEILDNVMLYYLPNTGASSARLYWEEKVDTTALKIDIPIGITQFAGEHEYVPKRWADRYYSNIVHWEFSERGGHFPAWEVPDIYVQEVRAWSRRIRK